MPGGEHGPGRRRKVDVAWIFPAAAYCAAALFGAAGGGLFLRLRKERRENARRLADLTHRIDSLEKQRLFLSNVIERMPTGVWAKEMDSERPCYVLWNRAMAEMSGQSPSEIIGKCDREIYTPEQARRFQKSDFELMQTGLPKKTHIDETLDAAGRRHFVQTIKTPLFDEAQCVCAVLGTVEDVTDRVRAVETLRASEARLRHVMDIAPIGICQTSARGDRLLYANPAMSLIFGYRNVDDLLSAAADRPLDELIYANPADRHRMVDEFLLSGKSWELFNVVFRRRNGEPFEAHLYLCVREGGPPGNDYFYAFIEDVSEQARTREENALLHRELEHVARVNTMGQLAASIAHEINQPLAAILSNAQAAQRLMRAERPDLNEIQNILQDIILDDHRAADVIQKMRMLLKRKIADVVPVDINPLVESVTALIHAELEGKQIDLRLSLEPELPPIGGDPVQLQQVMLNLLTNAMESMDEALPERREITISTHQLMGMAEIRVSDSGRGLSPEEMQRVFEPFYTTKENGMGMGLAINRTIIRALGGQIDAQPNPERGVTFFVRLPVIRTSDSNQRFS